MPDAITIQSLTSADRDTLLAFDQSAFGFADRDEDAELLTGWIEWDRAYGARRGDALGGIYVVYSYGLSVPAHPPAAATVVPMAGLSWVAVHPDHRRRGMLNAMIRHHLDTLHESGREPLSCLFASEPRIYGRYGYGVSTQSRRLTLPAKAELRGPRDRDDISTRFEAARPELHDAVVQQVYDRACRLRPGHTVRPAAQWKRHLADPPSHRPAGTESLRIVVAERDGTATGYATLRRKMAWGDYTADGQVQLTDIHAVDPASSHALWRRVLDLDLIAEVTTPGLPLDDPVMVWAGEAITGERPGHTLWTRIVDLRAALTARGYAADLEIVLEVSDELCPWNAGRWRLVAGADGSACERTAADPDVSLDIRELGSVYLGGTTFAGLDLAGLLDEHTPGAVAASSAAWRSPLLPATPYMF
jgi:predicted acetyltransferase